MIKRKYTYENFISLYNKGLNDVKIAEILDVSSKTIQSYRTLLKLPINTYKYYPDSFQRSVLIGTLLGDSHLRKNKDCKNISGSMGHCIAQEQYIKYKYVLLKEICSNEPKYYKNKKVDKRNGNIYDGYYLYFKGNEGLNWYYENTYKNNIKIINNNLLEYFDEISLAFLFMDDGYKGSSGGYYLSTNCFDLNSLELLINKLKHFGLEGKIDKSNRIYIPVKYKDIFNSLIEKWIIPSMQYKLHKSVVLNKQGELLENQETDNQQPSLSSNTFEGSTTNSQVLNKDSNANTSTLQSIKKIDDIV